MKTASASSQSGGHGSRKRQDTSVHRPQLITAEEFDRLADLPADDPAGDLEPYLDDARARRPGREVQRVNVDFPVELLSAIDREADRIGVPRQSFIKIRMADIVGVATRQTASRSSSAGARGAKRKARRFVVARAVRGKKAQKKR